MSKLHSETLNNVIGVDEAHSISGLSAGYIKNLCAAGKIAAKKIGKTWIIDKEQFNRQYSS
ncbi:TPA: helix-turn-helix domain-containing protein [Bacillus cereus]|nr:helix-turn-helix domain-containing protein [Bacillus cereus]